MKKWKSCLILFAVLVFFLPGVQDVMAGENGTTGDGFKWKYVNGVMEITGYEGNETVISIPSEINGHTVKKLHEGCFKDHYSGIRSITIPNTVTFIDGNAFANCYTLEDIKLPNSIKEIRFSTFDGCQSLKSVTIPNTVKTIDCYAFAHCTSLENVTIPNSVKYILGNAFEDCTALTEIALPKSIETIYDGVFLGCTNLMKVAIPNSVEGIGTRAFQGCTKLKSVTLSKSVTGIRKTALGYLSEKKKNPGFTLYGFYGSDAEEYAKKNGFSFVGRGEKINKAPSSVKIRVSKRKATVSWGKLSKKQKKQVKLIQIQYSTDKTFYANAKIKKVKKTKNSAAVKLEYNKYYFRLRFIGKNGVSKWSKVKEVKVK